MTKPKTGMLTPKRQQFVSQYVVDFNATQAAIRAGYSPRTARVQGSRLLLNADIAAALAELRAAQLRDAHISADRVLEEIRRVALAQPKTFFDENGNVRPIVELADEDAAAIEGFDVVIRNAAAGDGHTDTVHKIRLASKIQALELLAKYLGLLQPDALQAQLNVPVFVLPEGARVDTK